MLTATLATDEAVMRQRIHWLRNLCPLLLALAAVNVLACKPREAADAQSNSEETAAHERLRQTLRALRSDIDLLPTVAGDISRFSLDANMETLAAPAIAPDDADTNFSGVAYCAATKSFIVVDNEPNAQDRTRANAAKGQPKIKTVDQGDLYEYDAAGKLLRHIDLAGFDDPEAIALIGADPKSPGHIQYVIAEERIGELVVVSIPAYAAATKQEESAAGDAKDSQSAASSKPALTIDKAKLPEGSVVKLSPNLIEDGNRDANDGLEAVAYDADHDVFYVGKERGPKRGVYRVARDGKNAPVEIEGLFEGDLPKAKARSVLKHTPIGDVADLQYANGCLFMLSQETGVVVQVKLVGDDAQSNVERVNTAAKFRGEIVGQFPPVGQKKLPHRQPEGLAFTDNGRELWIVGEPRELVRYRLPETK
jgi:uncharacterized protein YjiK